MKKPCVLALVVKREQVAQAFMLRLRNDDNFRIDNGITATNVSPPFRRKSIFQTGISIEENLLFFSRLMHINLNYVFDIVDYFIDVDFSSAKPISKVDIIAEVAIFSILPYDCLHVADISHIPLSLRNILFETSRGRGVSIIFSTHHAIVAEKCADRVLYLDQQMEKGRIDRSIV